MKILVVDDENAICELLSFNLKHEGYEVLIAYNAQTAICLTREQNPALIVLDLMLPDMSGLDVCRVLKADENTKAIPIIMLTAKSQDNDIIHGLSLGADDYVTKPFSPKVLLARINSVLRRKQEQKETQDSKNTLFSLGNLTLDTKTHEVRVSGNIVPFSMTEFAIVELLLKHTGQVFSRKAIINEIKGEDYPVTERSIDVQVLAIRRKLETALATIVVQTIRGVGYKICDKDNAT